MSTPNTTVSRGTMTTPPPKPVNAPRNPASADPTSSSPVNSTVFTSAPTQIKSGHPDLQVVCFVTCGGGTRSRLRLRRCRSTSHASLFHKPLRHKMPRSGVSASRRFVAPSFNVSPPTHGPPRLAVLVDLVSHPHAEHHFRFDVHADLVLWAKS